MKSNPNKTAFFSDASWIWSFIVAFVFSLLVQVYDPLIKYKLQFPITPWELDGRLTFVNSFEKYIYWGRPVPSLLQFILPAHQNWFLWNLISLGLTPVICTLVVSISFSPKKHPYFFPILSVGSMLLLRSTSGFVSSWAYMALIINGISTFFGLVALSIMLKLNKTNRHQRFYSWGFVACTLLSVLSKQDAIFGLALAGLVVFLTQVTSLKESFKQKNLQTFVSLFPLPVLAVESLRNHFMQTFFTSNTGAYTRVLNLSSILDSFLKYPGAGISQHVFFAALALLVLLTILKYYLKKDYMTNQMKSELENGLRTSAVIIAFGIGLRIPYLILPYHQFDWYSNYWLLVDTAALALLVRTLLLISKSIIRVPLMILGSVCLLLAVFPGNPNFFPNDRIRVEGWYVQRVQENENIMKFLRENSLTIRQFNCIKVLNTSFESPWIFDSGSYLQSLLGKKIEWSVEVSDETYESIRQFPEFEFMSSLSDTQDIAIYSHGRSPELPNCGVIRFDGDLSSNGRIISMSG